MQRNWQKTITNFFLLLTLMMLILSTSGCKQVFVHKETGSVISKASYESLSKESQVSYKRAIQISEVAKSVMDKGGESIVEATPVIATISDLILPGLGAVLASVLGSFGVLYRKWKVPLSEAHTALDAIRTGAYLTGDAINEFKTLFPDAWKTGLKPLIEQRVEDLSENREDATFKMPDDVVSTTTNPIYG